MCHHTTQTLSPQLNVLDSKLSWVNVGQHLKPMHKLIPLAHCWPTVGPLLAHYWPTVSPMELAIWGQIIAAHNDDVSILIYRRRRSDTRKKFYKPAATSYELEIQATCPLVSSNLRSNVEVFTFFTPLMVHPDILLCD